MHCFPKAYNSILQNHMAKKNCKTCAFTSPILTFKLLWVFFIQPDKIKFKVVSSSDSSDNSQFPFILMVVKIFSASYVFWITIWRANKEQSNFFLEQNQIWRVHHWLQRQQMVTLVKVFGTGKKETSWVLQKFARTRTIKTSCELPAGSGKFPPVTCRNRRQSVPAEIFACFRRYFYLRISLPAAFAGNFARASSTV